LVEAGVEAGFVFFTLPQKPISTGSADQSERRISVALGTCKQQHGFLPCLGNVEAYHIRADATVYYVLEDQFFRLAQP